MENSALKKKKNKELIQSNLVLLNNVKISNNNINNYNVDSQIVPIDIIRTRLLNESNKLFSSSSFKLVLPIITHLTHIMSIKQFCSTQKIKILISRIDCIPERCLYW